MEGKEGEEKFSPFEKGGHRGISAIPLVVERFTIPNRQNNELEVLYDELDSLEFVALQPALTQMSEQIAKLREVSMQTRNENERLLEFSKKRSEKLHAVESRVETLRSECQLPLLIHRIRRGSE